MAKDVTLGCFVRDKEGMVCPYLVVADNDSATSRLIAHLMDHITEITRRLPDRFQCVAHPQAKVWAQGGDHGWRYYCGECNERLDPLSLFEPVQ